MSGDACTIQYCRQSVYAPAGTGSVCRAHFLDFLTWRRRRGMQMFMKYAAMPMPDRDAIVEEWRKGVKVEEPAVVPQANG
ncbi:MAG: hypothetical protein U0172_06725 [Nitrospiraceae bacterium]